MLEISQYFKEKWAERVGEPLPAAGKLDWMIKHSPYLQRCLDLYEGGSNGNRGRKRRVLALFWIRDDVVVKVDTINRVAVSVMTRNVVPRRSA